MADITKRTAKRLAASLEPGEQVEAAILIEAKGFVTKNAFECELVVSANEVVEACAVCSNCRNRIQGSVPFVEAAFSQGDRHKDQVLSGDVSEGWSTVACHNARIFIDLQDDRQRRH